MKSRSSITLQPTTSGWFVNHIWEVRAGNLPFVDEQELKRILWENVSQLMLKRYNRINVTKLAEEASIGGSASRIKAQETSVGIDVVAKVADVFGIAPHKLLMPPEERNLFDDKNLLRIAMIYQQTDDEGRRTLMTAAQIAEARIDAGAAGLGKAGKTDDR